MPNMQAWDWALLVIGAYIAVFGLVRLMRQHRDRVLQQLTDQATAEQQRLKVAKQLEKHRQAKGTKAKAA